MTTKPGFIAVTFCTTKVKLRKEAKRSVNIFLGPDLWPVERNKCFPWSRQSMRSASASTLTASRVPEQSRFWLRPDQQQQHRKVNGSKSWPRSDFQLFLQNLADHFFSTEIYCFTRMLPLVEIPAFSLMEASVIGTRHRKHWPRGSSKILSGFCCSKRGLGLKKKKYCKNI